MRQRVSICRALVHEPPLPLVSEDSIIAQRPDPVC